MFGCIVVATDLQASTRSSLGTACDLLHSEGQILLVHVIRPPVGLSDPDRDALLERMKAHAATRMHDMAAGFIRERAVEILCVTLVGTPGRQLAHTAAERGADLVILAHDPQDDPATLGSVSFQVAHLAPCSVLVTKTPVRKELALGGLHASRVSRVPRSGGASVP